MSNITKTQDTQFPEKATKEHKEVVLAANEKPLKEYPLSEIVKAVSVLLLRAKTIAGHSNSDPKVTEEAIDLISNKIKLGKYGGISVKQLEIAVEKGAIGDFGDFHGINAKTFNSWIQSYYEYQSKFIKEQLNYTSKLHMMAIEKKNEEHFKAHSDEYTIKRFKAEYEKMERTGGKVYDPQNLFYFLLVSKNLLPVPNPRREEFKAEAEKITKAELRKEKNVANPAMKTIINGWIEDLQGSLEGKPVMKAKFQSLVMDLIVTDFMKGHLELGSSFEEMIEMEA